MWVTVEVSEEVSEEGRVSSACSNCTTRERERERERESDSSPLLAQFSPPLLLQKLIIVHLRLEHSDGGEIFLAPYLRGVRKDEHEVLKKMCAAGVELGGRQGSVESRSTLENRLGLSAGSVADVVVKVERRVDPSVTFLQICLVL